MSEAFWGDGSGQREPLFVRFSMQPEQNQPKSEEAGRPIFVDKEYIEIAIPGDRSSIIVRALTEIDRRRFAQQYAAWKLDAKSEGQIGTPLEMWPQVTRSTVAELRYFKIETVEDLASVSDINVTKMQGMHALRKQAQVFLEAAKGNAVYTKLEAELAVRDNDIAALRDQVKQLGDELTKLLKVGVRKTG